MAGRDFVDFNLGLNKAANRLREVLDDSAEHPRFIETFPKMAGNLPSQGFQESNQRVSLLRAQFFKTSRRIVCFAIVTRDSIVKR